MRPASPEPSWPSWPATAGWCSPAVARGRCLRRSCEHGPAAAGQALDRLVAAVRARQRGGRAVGPRRPARLGSQRRAGRAGGASWSRSGRHQQRPLRRAGPAPSGHCPGRGACPAQPRRDRRLAARRRRRSPAVRSRAGPAVRPLPGRGGTSGRAGPGSCAFDLALVAPNLPPFPCPPGLDEMAHLRQITEQSAPWHRTGTAPVPVRTAPTPSRVSSRAWTQIDHELDVIERARVPRLLPDRVGHRAVLPAIRHPLPRAWVGGQQRGLLRPRHHQGRCRASRPVVRAVPVSRARWPARHRPRHRERSPGRGHPIRLRALWPARTPPRWPTSSPTGPGPRSGTWPRPSVRRPASRMPGPSSSTRGEGSAETAEQDDHEIPAEVLALAAEVEHFPRHLGIHSGGMVLCDRPVVEVCPVEWGRMENRSVLQWDKDDCAAVGLVKFDLLGPRACCRPSTTRSI